MAKFKVRITSCIITTWLDASDDSDAETKLHKWVLGLQDCDIDGYDTEIIPLVNCDWCGNEFDEDDLTLLSNGSLVCVDDYEEAIAEMSEE